MRTLGVLGEVIGLAATVCTKEKVYPRDVYTTHFNKLKAMMERGVPARHPYHAYECGESESYHFEDLGFIHIRPSTPRPFADPLLEQRIKALKVQHKNK